MLKLFIVTFLIRWTLLLAVTYEVQFENDDVFTRCGEFPDNFVDKFITMPENITLLPDGNIYAKGDVVLKYDFKPEMKYPIKIEFFKRERGEWQKTLYTVQRDDLCTAFFNPAETWHSLVEDLPEEQRKCPLEKGQIFSIDLTVNAVFELVASNLDGYYLARLEASTAIPPEDEFLCAEVYFNAYRI